MPRIGCVACCNSGQVAWISFVIKTWPVFYTEILIKEHHSHQINAYPQKLLSENDNFEEKKVKMKIITEGE